MATRFHARLHGPTDAQGTDVQAWFDGHSLHVECGDVAPVAASQLIVEVGGFDDDALMLRWRHDEADYALIAADAEARATVAAHAPAVLAAQLGRWRRRVRTQHAKWNGVVSTLLGVLLIAGIIWWQYDRIVVWVAAHVPVSTEERLGATVLKQVRSQSRLIERGKTQEMVAAIGTRLTQHSRYTYHWFIKDDPSVNAFAIPGGYVVVHRGLIEKANSAEELAGVLAHESQHVEQRHTLRAMIHSLGWATALAIALGDTSAMVGIIAHQAGTLGFSRDLERAADRDGIRALANAGIAPQGLSDFFERIRAEDGNDFAWLSSHPATDERIAALKATIASLPPARYAPLPYDWAAIEAQLDDDLRAAEKPVPHTGD